MAAPLRLALTGSTMGWVTQVQSNYGVQPATIARSFNGTLDRTLDSPTAPMETLGYYWHYPHLSDDNRGLGRGIAWAFDDELCNKNDVYGPKKKFEDTFREDFFLRVVCHLHRHPGVAAPRLEDVDGRPAATQVRGRD